MSGLIAKYCIVGSGLETHRSFPFTKHSHGFQPSAVMAGFDCINYPPIIETSECKLALELSRPAGGKISFHLFHESRPELKIIDMVYIEPFPKKFALHMALSYEGTYNLIVFANHEGCNDFRTTFASFLINNTCNQRASFFADPHSWGMHSHEHPVKCVDNCGSTIHAPCGEGSITFTSPRNRGEEIDFELYSPGKRGTWKEVTGFREWVFAEYIDSKEELRMVKIDFRIPLKGFFKFVLFYGTKSVGRWLVSCPKGFEGPLYPVREGLWGPDCKMTEELKLKFSQPARFSALDGKAEFTVTVPQAMSKWRVFAELNDSEGPKLIMRQKDVFLSRKHLSEESSMVYTFYIDLPDSVSTAILTVLIGQENHSDQKIIWTHNHGYWLVTATDS
ncbi:hypothetical protein HOLleu_02534 [Holothuria leucospilota]|uniref:Uncharacterized protein n=1 Tax=Holothuria leucospilota TaxID=206669 RepID=A0A9Q1CRS4_HOLLE|nr:hypothetical protein HOLleu_02534 [Holothuria leucospilota]